MEKLAQWKGVVVWIVMPLLPGIILLAGALAGEGRDGSNGNSNKIRHACLSSREFITAYAYLKEQRALSLEEKDRRDLAFRVAQGCTGAAKRFISVLQVLLENGVTARDSLSIANRFSGREDNESLFFIKIFQYLFLRKYFDLELYHALSMALALAEEMIGPDRVQNGASVATVTATATAQGLKESKRASPWSLELSLQSFEKVLDYCRDRKHDMQLPLGLCAEKAGMAAKLARKYGASMGEPFVNLVEFLKGGKGGPRLSTSLAFSLTEEVIVHGPLAAKNFMEGFQCARSKEGLDYALDHALSFAKHMARFSLSRDSMGSPASLQSMGLDSSPKNRSSASDWKAGRVSGRRLPSPSGLSLVAR